MSRLLLPLAFVVLSADVAHAQLWRRARDAASRGIESAVDRQVEQRADAAAAAAVDALFDAGASAVRCVFTDDACIRAATEAGQDVVLTGADGAPVDPSGTPVTTGNPEAAVVRAGPSGGGVSGADANYDFEPGERDLFADDFARDNVGDFPRRLEFRSGTMEVVAHAGGRALRVKTPGIFNVVLPEELPDRFTLEFDYLGGEFVNGLWVYPADAEGRAAGPNYVQVDAYSGVGVAAFGRFASTHDPNAVSAVQADRRLDDQMLPVRVMADGAYVKVFVGEERVANVPNADLGRSNRLRFHFEDVRDTPVHIANLRVAAGGRDLYGALEAEGRVVTEGVHFDTGSATLRPESFAVVQEIAAVLREHPALRVRVEGHTDAEGGPASSLALSQERANAVRAMLTGLGVAADRLEAVGLGQTVPVASNDTSEGRAANRRVELVRL